MSVNLIEAGDLFQNDAQAIVNAVNCVGAMGKGLALVFKQRYPANYNAYRNACDNRALRPGGLVVFKQGEIELPGKAGPQWIVNLATKDDWRDPSRMAWITEGAGNLERWACEQGVESIACPALGAGLGGLYWPDVYREICRVFDGSKIELRLFAPLEVKANAFRSRPSAR